MGARSDAIDLFKEFREDDFFKDAFYDLSWVDKQISGGGAFGGGTVVETLYSGKCNKSSDYDTISKFKNELVEKSTFVKGLIDEVGEPEVDQKITFDGKEYTLVDFRTDPTKAIISMQLVL